MSVKVPKPGGSREVAIVLDHGRTVSGRIRFAGGRPGAHLSICGSWMKAWGNADLDGRFTLSRVPRRVATLTVAQGDRRLETVTVPAEGEGFLKALDIVLDDRSRKLPLRVVYSDGAPATGTRVELTYVDRGWNEKDTRTVAVDADGRALIDGLRPGKATLVVNGPGLAPCGKPVEVGSNQPITVTLPEGRIQGRTTTRDGRPARVRIRLSTMVSMGAEETGYWSRQSRSDLVETDARGRFLFRGAGEGSYDFEFDPDGLAVIRGPEEAKAGDLDLTLVVGPESEKPRQYIVVRLVDAATGKPARNVGVGIPEHGRSEGGGNWCTVTHFDEEDGKPGVFTSPCLSPGTYTLQASGLDYQTRSVENVKLEANQDTELEIRLEPVPCLRGKVVDEQGRTVAGVHVSWTMPGLFWTARRARAATTDEQGAFELRRVTSADGRIEVRGDHHRGSHAMPAREKWSEPLTIVVRTVGALMVRFSKGEIPKREAKVVVRDVEHGSRRTLRFRARRCRQEIRRFFASDNEEEFDRMVGEAMAKCFQPLHLRPGRYRVEAFWDGRALAPRDIEVMKGRTVKLEFDP